MAVTTKLYLASLVLLLVVLASATDGSPELSATYYKKTCPNVQNVVRTVMAHRVASEPRMSPAILRLFFHDCFVNGCDASLLLDRTDDMDSEKDAVPTNVSLDGFDVIDEIKSALEHDCPATVSCADVLALASRDAVALLGGPSWNVPLGRKDSLNASKYGAENDLPNPHGDLGALLKSFEEHGLDARDLTALSGAHTIGKAHSCENYRYRVYGCEGANIIDPSFAARRRQSCQQGSGEAPFDEETPMVFDNSYFQDLIARRGLLTSDQELYTHGGPVSDLVEMYAMHGETFFADFAKAMVKMGSIRPPQGMPAEVRLNCRVVNY